MRPPMTATAQTRNGHGDAAQVRDAFAAEEPSGGGVGGLLRQALAAGSALPRLIAGRVPPADLDERDPDYIRETLPRLWLLSSIWFRGEVRGLGNVPEEGPVLLV